jgi:steroid delta-isomerase-like uncharacterized protein
MKKIFLIGLAIALFVACEQKEERYSTSGPEIDLVKGLLADYEKGDWDSWKEKYADTAKVYYNQWDDSITVTQSMEGHKANIALLSSYGFGDNVTYEKIISDNGNTWINFWGKWEGTLKENNKTVVLPVHLSVRVLDGKIVQENGFWDNSIMQTALREIEAMKNMPEIEKTIMANHDKMVEAWSTNDAEAFKALSVANVIRNSNGTRQANNQSEYAAMMNQFHTGFPDFNVKMDSYFLKDGKSYINWTCTGTNTGPFMNNPPTGKKIEIHGFSVWAFDSNGLAVQEDSFFDNMDMLSQLGYTLTPPEAN